MIFTRTSQSADVALSAGTMHAPSSDMGDAESCSGNGGRLACAGEALPVEMIRWA